MEVEHGEELPAKPAFAPLSGGEEGAKVQFRRIPVPQHRMTPLKTAWMQLYEPITKNLKLDMRMNLKTKKAGSQICVPHPEVCIAVLYMNVIALAFSGGD